MGRETVIVRGTYNVTPTSAEKPEFASLTSVGCGGYSIERVGSSSYFIPSENSQIVSQIVEVEVAHLYTEMAGGSSP